MVSAQSVVPRPGRPVSGPWLYGLPAGLTARADPRAGAGSPSPALPAVRATIPGVL
ncbi:hypothetical protein [Lysobacter gummosus]|uniref:hypothetical protein n=1 Tax=Lysobacter gummosus TaxID=262324 RepID=UPI003627EF02